eukprot:TRINITY_DN3468_c0_g1_i1.p1 TRINITY_DN3468_c0_g1~~TRINITY_DN3468_c0_g1_i1.p1  ORF type:complete len:155 (-),score=54.48 TRINITY_DN3468_c0_g1_i1:272-736(-)
MRSISLLPVLLLSLLGPSLATWSLRSDPSKSTLQRVAEDKKHLEEDLGFFKSPEEIEALTPLEISYTFFSSHDYDRNQGLDGSEVLKALHHRHAHEDERYQSGHISPEAQEREFTGTVDLIDRLFREFDKDDDGILSFIEFYSSYNSDITLFKT